MRDHDSVIIEDFNGWWQRGDLDTCPLDHFTDIVNYKFIQGGFETRDGVEQYINKQNIIRIYTYNTSVDGFLELDNTGKIYHTIFGVSTTQILSIANMDDFKYININGRAYITPLQNGSAMQNQFIYVYNGNGATARKAAGVAPVNADGALAAANGAAGKIEVGYHVFGVVYETDSGFFTQIGPDTLASLNATGALKANLTAIPVSPSSAVTKRHIVATKAIPVAEWISDTRGNQFFFVPGGEIANNTATTLTVDFFDSELIDDASYLLDVLDEIPASNDLTIYHGRLVASAKYGNTFTINVSEPGEPEAINAVSGMVLVPDNGLGIQAAHVYRDVLYVYKINSTYAVNDNNDEPSAWPVTTIDEAIGCVLHGVCVVGIYQGGNNIEFVVTMDYNGMWTFDGVYRRPELTWKVRDYWASLNKISLTYQYELYNDSLTQRLYINLNDLKIILVGDYSNGLDSKVIKWSKWTFDETIKSVTLFDKDNKLVIATSSYIYYIESGQTNDNWSSGALKIPDPTIVTALIGD